MAKKDPATALIGGTFKLAGAILKETHRASVRIAKEKERERIRQQKLNEKLKKELEREQNRLQTEKEREKKRKEKEFLVKQKEEERYRKKLEIESNKRIKEAEKNERIYVKNLCNDFINIGRSEQEKRQASRSVMIQKLLQETFL